MARLRAREHTLRGRKPIVPFGHHDHFEHLNRRNDHTFNITHTATCRVYSYGTIFKIEVFIVIVT